MIQRRVREPITLTLSFTVEIGWFELFFLNQCSLTKRTKFEVHGLGPPVVKLNLIQRIKEDLLAEAEPERLLNAGKRRFSENLARRNTMDLGSSVMATKRYLAPRHVTSGFFVAYSSDFFNIFAFQQRMFRWQYKKSEKKRGRHLMSVQMMFMQKISCRRSTPGIPLSMDDHRPVHWLRCGRRKQVIFGIIRTFI